MQNDRAKKLTDDCGPCYSCAKLAELMADNNALRVIVGDLKAPTDPGEASMMSVDAFVKKQTEHESQDTREKLEADIAHDFYLYKKPGLERIFGWLDRQAAITERECLERAAKSDWLGQHFQAVMAENSELQAKLEELEAEVDAYRGKYEDMEFIVSIDEAMKFTTDPPGYVKKALADLQARVDELTAERDEMKAENKLLRERKCPGYDPDRHYCEYHAQDFELNDRTVSELKRRVSQLEGDLKGARTSRDHWRDVAEKHNRALCKLRKQLKDAEKYGTIWPRFEDGAIVKFGDTGADVHGHAREVYEVQFHGNGLVFILDKQHMAWWANDCGPIEDPDIDPRKRVKRPPLKAKDGQPIEVGQTLYGEDGKAWVVEGIDRKNKWSVWAHYEDNADRHKCLKPEWLTHEKPDSWERIVGELRGYPQCFEMSHDAITTLADRIEKLGGGR